MDKQNGLQATTAPPEGLQPLETTAGSAEDETRATEEVSEPNSSSQESTNGPVAGARVDTVQVDVPENFAIAGINSKCDMDYYNRIQSVNPSKLSEEERAYSDDTLETFTNIKLRELSAKMVHELWEGTKKDSLKQKPSVSCSGKKPAVLGRVLAYYLFMRQEKTIVDRRWNNNPQFSPAEDARLIEIMTDPTIATEIKYAFQSGTRADIDAVSGSLVDFTWNAIIAGRYFNNFDAFEPPHRYSDPNHVLFTHDASSTNIQRRKGLALKDRFSTLRSRCTVINSKWGRSGDNDPDRIPEFLTLSVSLDRSSYYMWLRMQEGGDIISSRLLRQIPTGNDSMTSTRDNASLMAIMGGESPPNKNATNANNGGAIGHAARKTARSKKRKQGEGDEISAKIATTLEAIADPKGRLQSRATQLIDSISKLDDRMSVLLEEIDPGQGNFARPRAYVQRRRKLYREARKRAWMLRRQLAAIDAGHDDVGKLPPEEEPLTDQEEAYYLHDSEDEYSST